MHSTPLIIFLQRKGQGARHAVVGAQGLVSGDHDVKLVGQAGHVADAALPMVLRARAHDQVSERAG